MGKITLAQFIDKYNGESIDFDKAFGAQCVDLFNFYNQEVIGAPWIGTPVTNGARDLFEVDSAARRAYYDALSASTPLMAGDVLVYGEPNGRAVVNGKTIFYGHLSIYIGDGRVIQQNARIAQVTTIDAVVTKFMLGILRPRDFHVEPAPQTVPEQNQNKNKHTIVSGDTFWGLEEVYNMPHGTLQTLNPQLDPKRLTIGSDIVLVGQSVPPSAPSETYYQIVGGDTFWGLEDAWGFAHGTLQNLNPTLEPRKLQIGQRIRRS